MDIKKLRQQKADLVAKNAALLSASEAANRDLTATENIEYEANKTELASLNARIERVEAQMDEERNLPAGAAHSIQVSLPEATKKPWASLGEQLKAIHTHAKTHGAVTDPRLFAAALGGNESVEAEGGFLIAPEFAPGIWQRTYEASQVAKRAFEQPMTSNRLVINAVDEDSRVDGSRWGGIQSFYLTEAGTYTASQPKFRRMELIAKKLTALVYATDEQLEDSAAFAAYADKVVPLELAFRLDDNLYNGPGAGAPLGFMNSGALLTVTKDAGDTGAVISNNDIFNMWKRRWGGTADLVWFINQDVEAQLWNLERGSGTAVELLYTPPGMRGNNGSYGVMMGAPVIPVEYAATLGTPGDIVLANMSQYCFAPKGGIKQDSSIHVQFLTGQQVFRWQVRHDGQPFWKKPLTPKNGSNTLSPFIALSARS